MILWMCDLDVIWMCYFYIFLLWGDITLLGPLDLDPSYNQARHGQGGQGMARCWNSLPGPESNTEVAGFPVESRWKAENWSGYTLYSAFESIWYRWTKSIQSCFGKNQEHFRQMISIWYQFRSCWDQIAPALGLDVVRHDLANLFARVQITLNNNPVMNSFANP